MKFQDGILMPHTYIHTYGQAETNMSPLFQSWGHNKDLFTKSASPDSPLHPFKRKLLCDRCLYIAFIGIVNKHVKSCSSQCHIEVSFHG